MVNNIQKDKKAQSSGQEWLQYARLENPTVLFFEMAQKIPCLPSDALGREMLSICLRSSGTNSGTMRLRFGGWGVVEVVRSG